MEENNINALYLGIADAKGLKELKDINITPFMVILDIEDDNEKNYDFKRFVRLDNITYDIPQSVKVFAYEPNNTDEFKTVINILGTETFNIVDTKFEPNNAEYLLSNATIISTSDLVLENLTELGITEKGKTK